MKGQPKSHRTFSTAFKLEKVDLLDRGKISVREICEIYGVSETAVYKWKRKYSKLKRSERIVVEKISEEQKNKELLHRLKELEQIVGKKQIELDYYKTALDILSEEAGEDLLKKYKPR